MAPDSENTSARDYRPIPADEIEAQPAIPAVEGAADPAPHSLRTFYVTAPPGAEPHPSVRIEPIEGHPHAPPLWRVDLDLSRAVETPRLGISDGPVDLRIRERAPHEKREIAPGLDSHRPPSLPVSFNPRVQWPPVRTVYEFRGRRYRPLYIFGSDDRHVLTDTSWPWLLVGKIVNSDGNSGAGALVGGRVVLTVRHLRPERSIAAGSWWMKFTPHYFDGAEPFGSSFISDNRSYAKTGDGPTDIAYDFMVCRLYEPLGERLGFFGAQEYSEDWNDDGVWASVGYPGDIAGAERPAVELRCSIEDSEDYGDAQVMETEADLTKGNSGGPFWAWFPGHHARIVGVASEEADFGTDYGLFATHDHDNAVSGGADMVNLVAWARANWT
jgi:hypothetical protein